MSKSLGKMTGDIKRWTRNSNFRQWLFAYTLVSITRLGRDDDGDVTAYSENVFEDFTDMKTLSKAFTLTKIHESREFARYYDIYKAARP